MPLTTNNLKTFFELWESYKFWYHAIIPEGYYDPYRKCLSKYDITTFSISCKCHTNTKGNAHRHVIFATNVTGICNKLSCNLRRMTPNRIEGTRSWMTRRMYNKKIVSRVHLVNTLVYIQTMHTRGFHTGKLENCRHFDHEKSDAVLLTKTDGKSLRHEFGLEVPEYEEQQRLEYEKYIDERVNKESKHSW
jgi:hypothetical protein